MQGRSEDQRELLHAESIAGHLMKSGSVFTLLASQSSGAVPGRDVPGPVPIGSWSAVGAGRRDAAVIVLQTLHGLSDSETVDAVTFDLRWKAAVGWPVNAAADDAVATQDTVTQLIAAVRKVRCVVPDAAEVVAQSPRRTTTMIRRRAGEHDRR